MSELALARTEPDVVPFFRALADETRLAILRLLALSDLRVSEVGKRMGQPQNAVSYHLRYLRAVGLLRDRRSAADARDVYYSLDLDRLQALYSAAGDVLHLGGPQPAAVLDAVNRPVRLLFLCTHNAARSQLAEGLARYLGGAAVEACSAGSAPATVHPMALTLLGELGIDTSGYHAKSLNTYDGQAFDYIITVCDRVRESCPVFPDNPVQIHWSVPDPTAIEGEAAQWQAFRSVRRELLTRIRYLLALSHLATGGLPAMPSLADKGTLS